MSGAWMAWPEAGGRVKKWLEVPRNIDYSLASLGIIGLWLFLLAAGGIVLPVVF